MIGGVAVAAIVAPFFVQNYIVTGNPMFPWLNGRFHSPWLPPRNFEGIRFDNPLGPQSLCDLTFHGERFGERFQFQFGVSYYVLVCFLPLIFLPGGTKPLVTWVILGAFLPRWFCGGGLRVPTCGIFAVRWRRGRSCSD